MCDIHVYISDTYMYKTWHIYVSYVHIYATYIHLFCTYICYFHDTHMWLKKRTCVSNINTFMYKMDVYMSHICVRNQHIYVTHICTKSTYSCHIFMSKTTYLCHLIHMYLSRHLKWYGFGRHMWIRDIYMLIYDIYM